MVPRFPELYLQIPGRRQISMPKTHLKIPVRIFTVIGVTNLERGKEKVGLGLRSKTWEEWAMHQINKSVQTIYLKIDHDQLRNSNHRARRSKQYLE